MESSALSGRTAGVGIWKVDMTSGGDKGAWNFDCGGRPMKSPARFLKIDVGQQYALLSLLSCFMQTSLAALFAFKRSSNRHSCLHLPC